MSDGCYDTAADDLEQALRRHFPDIIWRIPRSRDLESDNPNEISSAVGDFRLEVYAQHGQRRAVVPVAGELVRRELAMAVRLTIDAANYAMDRVT